ncbi:MAG: hypothetical protein EBZ47_00065 [Chlamydiae bacterium]|nr:hypothetical protein [Chlamydiota bacterium]
MTKSIFPFLIYGTLCLWMAIRQKRNPVLWFCLGGFLGFTSVAFLGLLPAIRFLSRKRAPYKKAATKATTTIDVTANSKRTLDDSIP